MSEIEKIERSGGVKTDAGKVISKYNAQRHAVLRESITEYETSNYEQIYNELSIDLSPEGRLQEVLIELVASNYVRLQRIAKAESELIKEALSPEMFDIPNIIGKEYKPLISNETIEKLSLYSRYQTATENRLYRAISALKHLQYEQS